MVSIATEQKVWKAKWIADPRFAKLQPLNLLYKVSEDPALCGGSAGRGDMSIEQPHPKHLRNVHMQVRKVIEVEEPGVSAYIDISADDYYKLYINGEFVGQGPAQGYYFHYYYNRIDIGKWLRKGENVIAVHVYYQGLVNRALNSADLRQGFIAEVYSGERLIAATDETWKYRQALEYGEWDVETIGYETQFAEHIDRLKAEPGWKESDYDDRDWLQVGERTKIDYSFYVQPTPQLQVYTLSPKEIQPLEAGGILIDFGKEITGVLRLKTRAKSGAQLELRYGEELLERGSMEGRDGKFSDDGKGESRVRWKMRCNTAYREYWTLADGEDQVEGYIYKGFRYVEIMGAVDAIIEGSIAARVQHYPFPEEASHFRTEDALLQGIWDICEHGVRVGSQEHYVDCPTREKGQYLGDNSIIAPVHFYLTGDLRLYRKALVDFVMSSRICSGMMAVAPGHYMQEFADYSLQWPRQLLQYYHYSGERDFLEKMLPYAKGIVNHFKQFEREDGLLGTVEDKPYLVDWPANFRDGYDFAVTWPATPGCHNVINAFYYDALASVNAMCREVGEREPHDLAGFRQAFTQVFYEPGGGIFKDAEHSSHTSLHANSVALYAGLVPGDMQGAVVQFLKRRGMRCGVYMAYFYLKGLAAAGEYEYVYRTITSEEKWRQAAADGEEPAQVEVTGYWANMLKEGATSCFEAWSKRLKWNTSLCHPWASAPISLLVEEVFGLAPAEPGWKVISFQPRIPAGMEDLQLRLTLPAGRITLKVKNGRASLQIPASMRKDSDSEGVAEMV